MGEGGVLGRTISRRKFLIASGATAGAVVGLGINACDPYTIRKIQQTKDGVFLNHTAWVWQFSSDGSLETVASQLQGTGVGALLKTHDGLEWMSKYDTHPDAVTSASRAGNIASYFEDRGVPFHAWCVVRGEDPIREAEMCADVLAAGARSVVIDLEGGSGFWHGTPTDALRFGERLRTLSPYGRVDISIDPRPWRINLVPMNEFVAMSDAIWPQLYWDTFNTPGNHDGYRAAGFSLPADGTTPEFLLDTTAQILQPYGRAVVPIGQGAAADPGMWGRFAYRAWELGQIELSIWRLGVTRAETVQYLKQTPPGSQPAAPPPTATPEPGTPTKTATRTKSPTKTRTPNHTRTPRPTRTPSPTPSVTPSPSATETVTVVP